jgi:NAD(P)-dependent dehydrogenase (short-subunit alcohol dehydrogenase family)
MKITMKRTWIVTGSSVGLGRAIVEAALDAGHNVVATARNPRALDDLAARSPDGFLALRLDVANGAEARAVVAASFDRFGSVDVLVNNAGFAGVGSVEDMPLELVEKQLSTNFLGALLTSRAVLPVMRAQGQGRIILISSIGARTATAGAAIYYATKAAVSSLAESLALEVEPLGIKVTAVEPGAMRTRFAKADSMKVAFFDAAYEKTVGATVAMMRSSDFSSVARDPAIHAAMILRLAMLEHPPTRLLAGADAFEWGTGADRQRHRSDVQWEALSRSEIRNEAWVT